jgi:hypothetical protein
MGLIATLLGGGVGFGVQMFSNAIQKIPLSRGTCVWHETDLPLLETTVDMLV